MVLPCIAADALVGASAIVAGSCVAPLCFLCHGCALYMHTGVLLVWSAGQRNVSWSACSELATCMICKLTSSHSFVCKACTLQGIRHKPARETRAPELDHVCTGHCCQGA